MRSAASTTRRPAPAQTTGLARTLSKLGFCSRRQAWEWIRDGRVRVGETVVRDPERRTDWARERIEVDGQLVGAAARVYLMLNKPRGLVTTMADEQGRDTVYACLAESRLPFVSPVGRLDKASEGLLLFTNDTLWAARLTDPASRLEKTYHVQVDCVADEVLVRRMTEGVLTDGIRLRARRASLLRQGEKHSWIEVGLDEGRNRHIRRLLHALSVNVLRLVRVAIGPLQLGDLPKGQARPLTADEVEKLGSATRPHGQSESGARGHRSSA
jgi:23S rRNA pseudouridine2605 synthase